MMYKCSEKFNLDIETLSCLEKSSIEDVDQETLEEEEAIKTSEEEFNPISDDEEGAIEENSPVLSAGDGTSRECMMSDVSPTHDIHEQEDEEDDEENEENEQNEQNEEEATEDELLPPPIQQLRDRSQKRSSGRVTVPSSRLQGYELY
jgi:TATA-binding protein-associated factor Taf7